MKVKEAKECIKRIQESSHKTAEFIKATEYKEEIMWLGDVMQHLYDYQTLLEDAIENAEISF